MTEQSPNYHPRPAALRLAEFVKGWASAWPEFSGAHKSGMETAAELLRLHAENQALATGYAAARLEIASLKARVQELEAMLDAVGAGGVEPLRRGKCLHQIEEPVPAVIWQEPTGDMIRAIARNVRTSASDDAGPHEYVIAGWKAAVRHAVFQPQPVSQPPAVDSATLAGLIASEGHLSTLVDKQRALLVEIEDQCGRGWFGPFEDGESEIIDKVHAMLAMTSEPQPPAAAHPDDAAVDALAVLMKAKLAKQRKKGYGGWETPKCTQHRLSTLLRDHVDKGDPVDVANFCAFLSARGEGIVPQSPAPVRKPLTGGQINQVLRRLPENYRRYLFATVDEEDRAVFTRAIEAAHGITGEP